MLLRRWLSSSLEWLCGSPASRGDFCTGVPHGGQGGKRPSGACGGGGGGEAGAGGATAAQLFAAPFTPPGQHQLPGQQLAGHGCIAAAVRPDTHRLRVERPCPNTQVWKTLVAQYRRPWLDMHHVSPKSSFSSSFSKGTCCCRGVFSRWHQHGNCHIALDSGFACVCSLLHSMRPYEAKQSSICICGPCLGMMVAAGRHRSPLPGRGCQRVSKGRVTSGFEAAGCSSSTQDVRKSKDLSPLMRLSRRVLVLAWTLAGERANPSMASHACGPTWREQKNLLAQEACVPCQIAPFSVCAAHDNYACRAPAAQRAIQQADSQQARPKAVRAF